MRMQVLRDRNMRVLFAGQSLNMFGNSAMIIVLGIWTKDLTHSNAAAGIIFLLLAGRLPPGTSDRPDSGPVPPAAAY